MRIILFLLLVLPLQINVIAAKAPINKNPVSLIWEMGSHEVEKNCYQNSFSIVNSGPEALGNDWTIYFCQKQVVPQMPEDAPVIMERIMSTYYKFYPSKYYEPIQKGDTLKFTFICAGSFLKEVSAPSGAYIVYDVNGKETHPTDVQIEVMPFTCDGQWSRSYFPERPYPYGELVYGDNRVFSRKAVVDKTDIFPSVKNIVKNGGEFDFTKSIGLKYDPEFENEAEVLKNALKSRYGCNVSGKGATVITLNKSASIGGEEAYRLTLNNNKITISGSDAHGIFNGTQTLLAMVGAAGLPTALPNVTINDYPDVGHRGLMLDVARNFTTKANLLKLIDLLAMYKMNVLHLHLTDDEGWRIEIPGLEELTGVGSRRGHTHDESECLYPLYGGGWDPASDSPANGFYTREDFIEILKYAARRHIKVIPEVDLPGHARAAIKSMDARYRKYESTDKAKAGEFLLADPADTSQYLSAQSFTDNTINVAMPSVYKFVEKVVYELNRMYSDSGMKLETLHLGGDEVPKGAWTGSGIARELMQKENMIETRDLKDYFVARTLEILEKYDIRLGAWQEVSLLPDNSANERFAGKNVLSYCWSTIPEWGNDQVPYNLANAGYEIILSNLTNFYFDLSYNKHHMEPGAYWAGFVNEFDSFNMLPYDIYKSVRTTLRGDSVDIFQVSAEKVSLNPEARKSIKGLQGQLWAETIRDFDMVTYYLFPKIYGLVERAWNNEPEWKDDPLGEIYNEAVRKYYAKISVREMPLLTNLGIDYRLPHPGICIIDGKLYANTPVSGAEIRYTTDGSEPAENSTLWTAPVACDSEKVKAKIFYQDRQSVTSALKQ